MVGSFEECVFELPGIVLSGWRTGSPKKGRVLAIHGWLDNANSFLPLVPFLDQDWEIISIDLAGHGRSHWRPASCSYHFIDYVTEVLHVCNQLSDQPLSLIGHSLGAAIATVVSTVPPKHLVSAVLIDGLGPLSNPAEITHEHYKLFLQNQERISKQATHFYSSFDEVLEKRLKASPMNPAAATLILERSLIKEDSGWRWRSDPRHMARNPLRLTEDQVLSFLENIQRPCLFIEASRGDFHQFKYKVLPERLRRAKSTQHRTLQGDHHIHCDAPEKIAELIHFHLNDSFRAF